MARIVGGITASHTPFRKTRTSPGVLYSVAGKRSGSPTWDKPEATQ